ncbi:MAG: ParB N-terminal domain-containing protein [Nocardioidaceae bacterium]
MPDPGHIELERSIDSIRVGARHRCDLGDLDPLVRSIERLGLLQPITIAPDGSLLCGRRRLEAIKRLGWHTVRVWVRSGISDKLNSLLAWQDENTLHKPLSAIEAAELYRELKLLRAEDAGRRQRATRFAATTGEADGGGGDSPPPGGPGKVRDQAAKTVTGSDSSQRLERVTRLQDLAADESQPQPVRELAAKALSEIAAGAPVSPSFHAVADLRRQADADPADTDELERLAREALERIKQPKARRRKASESGGRPSGRSLRAFIHTWTDMDGWSTHHDPAEVGPALPEEEWVRFERVVAETNAFHDAAKNARAHPENRHREPVPA